MTKKPLTPFEQSVIDGATAGDGYEVMARRLNTTANSVSSTASKLRWMGYKVPYLRRLAKPKPPLKRPARPAPKRPRFAATATFKNGARISVGADTQAQANAEVRAVIAGNPHHYPGTPMIARGKI